MSVFARTPPPGWVPVYEPLRGALERLGVPLCTAPTPVTRASAKTAFWAPAWSKRLYWEWPKTMSRDGKVGLPTEHQLLEHAVHLLARDQLGDPEQGVDALLASYQLGGFDAVQGMLRGRNR